MEGGENKQQSAMEKEEKKEVDISLKELSRRLQDFAMERDWEQYHSPRNLLLAMVRKIFFVSLFSASIFFVENTSYLFPLKLIRVDFESIFIKNSHLDFKPTIFLTLSFITRLKIDF